MASRLQWIHFGYVVSCPASLIVYLNLSEIRDSPRACVVAVLMPPLSVVAMPVPL